MTLICPPPKKVLHQICEEVKIDEENIEESIVKFKEWLLKQPHLPHDHEDGRLKRLFVQCKCRMEIAKSVLDMYYTLRGKLPDIFSNRDPFLPWFKTVCDYAYIVTLPQLTEDYCRVTIIGPVDPENPPEPTKLDLMSLMKLGLMIQDIRYAEDYSAADIVIADVQRGTPAHAAKFTLPVFKKLQICALKGYKARVKQVHLLNASPFMDAVLTLGRTLVKQKHKNRLIVHRDGYLNGYDSLHKYISPKILPKEYGGEAGSVLDMWEEWKQKIYSYRDWFLNQGSQTADESKRPGKPLDHGDLFGFEGSFRQLNVD